VKGIGYSIDIYCSAVDILLEIVLPTNHSYTCTILSPYLQMITSSKTIYVHCLIVDILFETLPLISLLNFGWVLMFR
jgi:hypothetical protein